MGSRDVSRSAVRYVRTEDTPIDETWLSFSNITRSSSEGWFPAYCLKRLDEYVESEGLVPSGAQPIANADREVQGGIQYFLHSPPHYVN